jgi:hypothetical protein
MTPAAGSRGISSLRHLPTSARCHSATQGARRWLRFDEGHGLILGAGFVRLDGLRFAEVETVAHIPWSFTRKWRWLEVQSGGTGLHETCVGFTVGCPASQWPAHRATLLAVLASMRFTRPKG